MGWELEDTCLVGYWAQCAFVNQVQQKVQWGPANLRVGSEVGVLVTKDGDLKIFVDHMEVDCLKGVINVTPKLKLYPVMDIYHTWTSVKLLPWEIEMSMAGKSLSSAKSSVSQNSILQWQLAPSTRVPPSGTKWRTKIGFPWRAWSRSRNGLGKKYIGLALVHHFENGFPI